MENSVVKNKLKSLCCCNGWSYGVFWRYDHRNSMLLTFDDAYYEEQIWAAVESLLPQVHMLGEGIVGQVAFTGRHHWMLFDAQCRDWKPTGDTEDVFKDSVFDCQTTCGIKTISVISVEPWGVVQFGSTQKILETTDFLDQTQMLFKDVQNVDGLISLHIAAPLFEHGANDNSGLIGSVVESGNCSNRNHSQVHSQMSSVSWIQHERINSTLGESSHGKSTVLPEFQNDSTFNPFDTLGVGIENFEPKSFDNLTTSSSLTSSNHESEVIFPDIPTSELTFPEEYKPADLIENLSEFFTIDDLSQWFTHSASPAPGVSSVSSSLIKGDLFTDTPIKHTAYFGQSSITNHLDTSVQEEFLNTGSDESTAAGMNFENAKIVDFCKNQVIPIESSTHSAITAAESDCFSELIASPMTSQRGLFSELGLHELLNGIANSTCVSSSFQDGLSTNKRRKIESSIMNWSQIEQQSLLSSVGTLTSVHDRESSFLLKREISRKLQVGLWIDDSYSINNGDEIGAKPKRPEEPTKISRKRTRPGESTRPRPKDRQQIQDRIKELRGIIPNGQKSSIDLLLDRTIKYMLFLQSVTKYADKLIQANEPKLIDQENGVILKDSNTDSCTRGATWAYEIGSQTTVCPIIVEDLSPPGQMLIEMLCEDQGLFLEIADVIRGIGLNILKGVMEVQGIKIWAQFTVEANIHVTRMDIFWSLVQLLQDTATSGIDITDQTNIATDGQIPHQAVTSTLW